RQFYAEMVRSREFQNPVSWQKEDLRAFDGLYLPGGHAPGMRQYLGDLTLQQKVAAYFADTDKPVAAICHGPVVLARAKDASGKSVIHDARVTALPKYME